MRYSIFFLLFISFEAACAVYFSHLSNAWYPAKGRQLRRKIEHIKELAQQKFSVHGDPHQIRAILVPHASYDYSGVVAASAYQALERSNIKRVFIIGPSHYVDFQGVALADRKYEKFGNDVGSVRLDHKVLKKLRSDDSKLFKTVQRAYDLEHSIEIQIPLIQNYCPSCSIIPLLLGDLDDQQLDKLANILRSFMDHETICIFTSDLTHFGKSFSYTPFTDDISQNIVRLDQNIVSSIERLHKTQFEDILHRTKATVCGYIPIKLLLTLFQNSDLRAYVACYDRSTHEKNPNHSVSYVSMIFSSEQKIDLAWSDQLTGYEKMVLKKFVQKTLEGLFDHKQSCICDYILTDTLHDHLGLFVTLNDKQHQMRGCVGKITINEPLYKTVCDMTRAAALHDGRFSPVTSEEIPELTFEISVLSYPQEIDSYQKIQLGIDGIILKYKNKSALFLPEVALEQGWNLEKTLQELSRKAGLESEAYKKKETTFEVFQTIKIR